MSTSIFLLWLVSIPLLIHAIPDPRGYLLNCGSTEEIEHGGVKYITDEGFISTGNLTTINKSGLLPVLSTLRYFPDGSVRKNCYEFQVIKGEKFLIRTTYFYGGFDGGDEPPVFDQVIDGTKWSTVNTTEDYKNGLSSYYEIIVVSHAKTLSVCLARNEHTVSSPFISALELQHLDGALYNSTDFGKFALVTVARNHFGAGGDIISFPDDQFNRYWQPFMDSNPPVQSHSNISSSEFWNAPPAKVFATGLTTSRGKTLTVRWPPFPLPSSHYHICLYFQDNRTPSPFSWRVFSVSINGETFYAKLNVTADGVTVYGKEWPLSGQTEIEMTPRSDMSVGPVINAGEVYQILPLGGRTVTRDVMAMEELRRRFDNPPQDWRGDPCLPKQDSWSGVTCSEGKAIRVLSLNLTKFGLSGSLPEDIAKLTALKDLWLGQNQLSGAIPDLSPLKALETLHLDNNKFQGSIPESLGRLPEMREMFLHNNNFNGSIPTALMARKGINLRT